MSSRSTPVSHAGSSLSSYLLFQHEPALYLSTSSLASLVGNDKDYLPARAAHQFGLQGPCVGVQTACSTSLVAVHLACQSLLSRECDLALAGGVAVRVPQRMGYLAEEGGILARDGRCRAFDRRADGTVFGSGVGAVVLRRLEDALAAGDRVRAVVLGSAVTNDGRAKIGFTAPGEDGQAGAVAEALAVSGVDPLTIAYVECHGTGTPLGDPIEVAALARAFGPGRGSVALASVKTNVGHLESAAGVAGLAKAILALERGEIPASLGFEEPNPHLRLEATPFRIAARLEPWPAGPGPRRAGVSSFGMGGTNAHVVLEEGPAPRPAPLLDEGERVRVLPISARSEAALRALAGRYVELLDADGAPALSDVCHSAAARRAHHPFRLAVVGRTGREVSAALAAFARGEPDPRLRSGRRDAERAPRVAIAFPEAPCSGPGDEAVLAECDRALERLGARREGRPGRVASQMALASTWRALGIVAERVEATGDGEVAARWFEGSISADEAMRLSVQGPLPPPRGSGPGAFLGLAGDSFAEDLARLYVHGCRVRWRDVPFVREGRSVPLPAYPWQRERYWLERRRRSVAAGLPGRRLRSPNLSGAVFEVVLDPEGWPGLADHRIDERTVVPGAFHLSMLLAAAREELGSGGFVLEGVTFPRPLVIEIGRPVTVQAILEPEGAGRWRARVVSAEEGDAWSEHASARMARLVGPGASEALDEARSRCPTVVAGEVFYAALAARGVEIGRAARRVEGVFTGEGEAVADLTSGGGPRAPARLDAVFHGLAAASTAAAEGGVFVPVAIDRVALFEDAPRGRLACRARARPAPPGVRSGDAVLATSGGRTLIEVGGLVARSLGGSGAWLHAIEWRAADPPAPGASCWRIVGEGELADSLRRCVPAGPAEGTLVVGTGSLEANVRAVLEALGRNERVRIVTAGAQLESSEPLQAALWGLGRTIALERRELFGGLIDLDPGAPDPARALDRADGEDQVAYRGGVRRLARLVRASNVLTAEAIRIRSDAAYLVTGGLGALGLAVARWLVGRGARRLVLAGRRPPADPVPVESLRAAGVEVAVVSADVSGSGDLVGAGPLAGIIHAAGVLDDGVLASQSWERFERVLAPKARAAERLVRLARERGVDFLALFSSSAGVLGSPGQANYAAANAAMDAVARRARAEGVPAISIVWGPWAGDGMAAASGEAGRRRRAALGMDDLPPAQALETFGRLLGAGIAEIAVLPARWEAVGAAWPGGSPRLLERLVPSAAPVAEVARELERLAPAELEDRLLSLVRAEVRRALDWPAAKPLGDAERLFELGLDSLLAIDLRERLQIVVGRPLPATLLFERPTVGALAAHLAGEFAAPVAAEESDLGGLLEELEEMSEEEAARMLSRLEGGA